MRKTPHLVQYQGSKRIIAPEIVKFFPPSFDRLIEPFSGTCAITIFSAMKGLCDEFWINCSYFFYVFYRIKQLIHRLNQQT